MLCFLFSKCFTRPFTDKILSVDISAKKQYTHVFYVLCGKIIKNVFWMKVGHKKCKKGERHCMTRFQSFLHRERKKFFNFTDVDITLSSSTRMGFQKQKKSHSFCVSKRIIYVSHVKYLHLKNNPFQVSIVERDF